MSKALTRADILGRNDIRVESLDIPEWGGRVFVRSIGADERDKWDYEIYEASKTDEGRLPHFRARYAALVICDEDGNPIFTERDIEELGKKNAAAIERIFDKGRELSRMDDDAVEQAVEDLSDGPSDDSGSD